MTEKLYNDISENINDIKENIAKAAKSVGRDPEEIKLMAVTKTVPAEIVNIAIEKGIILLGENRAQELLSKVDNYNTDKAEIHFIGALQSNKVKQILDRVSLIQSLDRKSLVKEIEKQAKSRNLIMDVLIQVNIGREETKAGIMPENMVEFVRMLEHYPHVNVRGLMAIPPICDNEEDLKGYFKQMQRLYSDLKQLMPDNNIDILSMGMSGDYEIAIKNGSNLVRIGTAIFGARK